MKKAMIATSLTMVLVSALAGQVSAQDIGGRYSVEGTNLDGSPYRGTADVRLISETSCTIVWQTGDTTSQGICMRSGGVFAASYRLGDSVGMVIYRVEVDGSLHGAWTIAGVDGSGTEILTPQ